MQEEVLGAYRLSHFSPHQGWTRSRSQSARPSLLDRTPWRRFLRHATPNQALIDDWNIPPPPGYVHVVDHRANKGVCRIGDRSSLLPDLLARQQSHSLKPRQHFLDKDSKPVVLNVRRHLQEANTGHGMDTRATSSFG